MTPAPEIALITGMQFEALIAKEAAKESGIDDQIVLVAGPGAVRGRKVVDEAKSLGAGGIVSFGVCGGLDPALRTGAVILPETILTGEDGGAQVQGVDPAWRARLHAMFDVEFDVFTGPLLTLPRAVASAGDKAALFEKTGAQGVDMESAVLAREAQRCGLSFIACRVVLDAADLSVPERLAKILEDDGKVNGLKLVKTLIFHWPGAKVLKEMSTSNDIASANMSALARLALPGFGFCG